MSERRVCIGMTPSGLPIVVRVDKGDSVQFKHEGRLVTIKPGEHPTIEDDPQPKAST